MTDDIYLTSPRARAFVKWLATSTELERYDHGNVGNPRCDVCGRVEAASDCDPDPTMCWFLVYGHDPRCELLRVTND